MPKKGLDKLILMGSLEKIKTQDKEKTAAPAVAVFNKVLTRAIMEEEKKENNQRDL